MTVWWRSALRAAAIVGVVAAILDPGCARPARPRLSLAVVGELPDELRAATLRRVREAAPWADVVPAMGARVDAFLVAGDAAPVLHHLRAHPAALAIQLTGTPYDLAAVDLPPRVMTGSAVPLRVHLRPTGRARPPVRLTVVDAETGAVEATAETSNTSGEWTMPWLAVREGPRRLRVRAEPTISASGRPSPWAEISVDVRPSQFTTHLLEGRPTWVGRFTRLALAAGGDTRLTMAVRSAPTVTLQRQAPDAPPGEAAADVVIASGLDALTIADVARLERLVREGGRVLVLLLDEAPGGGPWRRLWPGDLGRPHTARTPRALDVGGARWRATEWLTVPSSTALVPLAYLDQGPPAVLARALGEGRVVLVTALDAWRWRAEADVGWAAGWHALLRRLAADVPPPVAVTAWVAGHGTDRILHVDARVRGDLAGIAASEVEARVETEGGAGVLTLARVKARRWRGGTRVTRDGRHDVAVTVSTAGAVVERGTAVVHVGPVVPPTAWSDVTRHQAQRQASTASIDALDAGLEPLRQRLVGGDGARWFVTRTWGFASLVLAALGTEWVMRRARRLP